MYLPSHFAEQRPPVLHALMRAHPLATVVAATGAGLTADLIPLLLDAPEGDAPVRLRGHVARANALWHQAGGGAVLAVFSGPQRYISPGWYATKREHGKVVPTWNYCTVQAHGRLQVHDDPAWVRALVDELTTTHEAAMAHPWSTADAPPDYIAALLANIVGIEIEVQRLEGKWKVSQNQPAQNRASVLSALQEAGDEDMAHLVRAHAPKPAPG